MFVKFRGTMWSNTFAHFRRITFKLGRFPNFKVLFPAVTMNIRLRVYIYSKFLNDYTVLLMLKIFFDTSNRENNENSALGRVYKRVFCLILCRFLLYRNKNPFILSWPAATAGNQLILIKNNQKNNNTAHLLHAVFL